MTTTRNGVSPARQAVALVCSVIAAVCTITVGVLESRDSREDRENSRQTQYDQCLSEERDRIEREGGLLEAESLCDIHPGSP